MKFSSKTALACAVAALSVGAQASFEKLYDDASVSGKLRTTYYDIKKSDRVQSDGSPKADKTNGAWTAGLTVDAKSGYAWDMIGFDASLYSANKLHMDKTNGSSNQLLNDANEGFSKIGQAYVKMKLGSDQLNAKFKAGRQIIYNGLVSSSGSRTVPSSWQGYNLNGQVYGVKYGFAYADKMSLRNEAGFDHLVDFNGKRIDYVMGGQLSYKMDGLELLYRNGFSKNFLKAHNVQVGYTFALADDTSLTVDTRYFTTKKDGEQWDGSAWWDPAFDDKAEYLSLNASMDYNRWMFVASVAKTKAESSQGLGKYYYDFGKNTHGIWSGETSAFGENFFYDGEVSYKIGGEYDFADLGAKGLRLGYFFHYGSGMTAANGKDVGEYEHDFLVVYKFQQPALKGLSYKLKYGFYKNDNALRDTIGYGERNDLRTWLDYKFIAF